MSRLQRQPWVSKGPDFGVRWEHMQLLCELEARRSDIRARKARSDAQDELTN